MESLQAVAEKLTQEFGLIPRVEPTHLEFYAVNTASIRDLHSKVRSELPVVSMLKMTQENGEISIFPQRVAWWLQWEAGLSDFSEKLDSTLKKMGFEELPNTKALKRGPAGTESKTFYRLKVEVKAPVLLTK